MPYTVAAFYFFTPLADLPKKQARLKACGEENTVSGTVLIAPEGVNGTIAAPGAEQVETFLDTLDELTSVRSGELKYSAAAEQPFRRLRIRLKKEIITIKAPEADPNLQTGERVNPEDWNAVLSDPDVTVLDTRNTYETACGTFRGAIDPRIDTFTEFKAFVDEKLDPAENKKIAMFCTGGIRCEKASAYMLARGFEDVKQLQGGILKYLETVPAEKSLWDGDCFVFDGRVAVGHSLEEGEWTQCFGCRTPLRAEDTAHPLYEPGVACHHCAEGLTPEQRAARRMRHSQMTSL